MDVLDYEEESQVNRIRKGLIGGGGHVDEVACLPFSLVQMCAQCCRRLLASHPSCNISGLAPVRGSYVTMK